MSEMKLRDESAQCDFKIEDCQVGDLLSVPFVIYDIATLSTDPENQALYLPQPRPATGPEIALWNALQKRGVKWGKWTPTQRPTGYVRHLICSHCNCTAMEIAVVQCKSGEWQYCIVSEGLDNTLYDFHFATGELAQAAAEKAAEEYLKERGMK